MSTDTALKAAILQAAIRCARSVGFMSMLRRQVARTAGCSPASVSWHFGSMSDLRIALMSHAVKHEVLDIVAQGLAIDYLHVRKAPEALKRKAARILAA